MDNLEVHDIAIQDQVRLASGKAAAVRHLTFYVGTHGPFIRDFDNNATIKDEIQAFIQQTVSDLRAITTRTY